MFIKKRKSIQQDSIHDSQNKTNMENLNESHLN
jgi:hypothetical protein